jgi:hypothetical protein
VVLAATAVGMVHPATKAAWALDAKAQATASAGRAMCAIFFMGILSWR